MPNENQLQTLYTMYCLSCTKERIANGEKLDIEEYLADLIDLENMINQKGILHLFGQDTAQLSQSNPHKGGQ